MVKVLLNDDVLLLLFHVLALRALSSHFCLHLRQSVAQGVDLLFQVSDFLVLALRLNFQGVSLLSKNIGLHGHSFLQNGFFLGRFGSECCQLLLSLGLCVLGLALPLLIDFIAFLPELRDMLFIGLFQLAVASFVLGFDFLFWSIVASLSLHLRQLLGLEIKLHLELLNDFFELLDGLRLLSSLALCLLLLRLV